MIIYFTTPRCNSFLQGCCCCRHPDQCYGDTATTVFGMSDHSLKPTEQDRGNYIQSLAQDTQFCSASWQQEDCIYSVVFVDTDKIMLVLDAIMARLKVLFYCAAGGCRPSPRDRGCVGKCLTRHVSIHPIIYKAPQLANSSGGALCRFTSLSFFLLFFYQAPAHFLPHMLVYGTHIDGVRGMGYRRYCKTELLL